MRKLGPTIRILRTVQEITIKELASKSGLSEPYIGNLENGSRTPSLEALDNIALALNINAALLLFISDMDDPMTAPLMPMVYMSIYNKVVPAGSQWRYP